MAVGIYDQFVNGLYRYVLEPAGISPADVAWMLDRIPQFLLILVLFYVLTKAIVWVLGKTLLSPSRVDPMLAHLVDRLLLALLMFVGFTVALMVFGINVFSLAITLGLVGAALALGLQNTVANIMGGISLVSDRPFEVGDRVQIGEFWGDVEEIGLRSTRILTVRREYVVIPNRLMDEREIWNYTKRYPELRIDVGVPISYDSDPELARRLMLDVARRDSDVLSFPKPRVLVQDFEDSGMGLELQCFIQDARERYPVASDLRVAIHRAFDDHGVEIPYPYRTLVDKAELPTPRRLDSEGTTPTAEPPLGPRRLLVATAGATPALNKAETIVKLAKQLSADLVVAYIVPRSSIVTRREGERAAGIFETAAEREGVAVKLVTEEGDIIESISSVVRRERCGAVVIGGSRTPVLMAWKSANVEQRLQDVLDVPVIVVDPDLEIDPRSIQGARASLDQIAGAGSRPGQGGGS